LSFPHKSDVKLKTTRIPVLTHDRNQTRFLW
jgi:hypothetical protein